VNSTWPGRSILHSCGCGSFTFTIISALAKTSAAVSAMVAPAASKAGSRKPAPRPALRSTSTLWP
jgi:hypothetical protein